MSESKELVAQVPSDRDIVRRYRETVAISPKHIQPGEAVMVDRHGVAHGRPRFVRLVTAMKLGIYGAIAGGAVLAVAGFWIPGALLYLAGSMPIMVSNYRGGAKLMAVDVLVRQGNLEEGQRRFDAAPELRRRNPAAYFWIAGSLASHRGDYSTAIQWWREGLPRSKGVFRERFKLSIAKALLLSGRVREARLEYESVKLPPAADEMLTSKTLARVMFALCDSSSEPPSEDELHDWARRALEYSHTGVELAAIGWAFDRSGDEDMARFLAAEAVERMHYPYLATWWPALQQWLDAHTTKRELPEPAIAPLRIE